VIGAITPVTHSLPTLAGNAINMLGVSNTVVFNAHPSGANIAAEGVQRFNRAIRQAIGLEEPADDHRPADPGNRRRAFRP